MLERYGHGGDLETAAVLYGRPADSFVDFSSNMNPWGPPERVKAAVFQAWEAVSAYPDPAARKLRALLSERHGVPLEAVWVGNGAAEVIDLALRAVRPAVTATAAPSFAEYETAARHADSRVVYIAAEPEQQFEVTAEAVAAAAAEAEAVVLGHPNNPTGRPLSIETMEAAWESYRYVVIDEAFLDFAPDEAERTLARRAAERPGRFVIRSMTKFYSIPGLRLGYVIAHPEEIARIRSLAVPWSVNAFALAAGEAALADREFAARTREWLPAERAWFAEQLQALGLQVFPSIANFLLVRFPPALPYRAADAQAALGRHGLLIRNAATFRGLEDGTYIRLAVKKREDHERLLAALQEWMKGAGT